MVKNKLAVIDGETLMDMRLAPIRYCIEGLLPQGVAMISGAPKIGKSWMMLDWTVRIAKGDYVWNFKTTKGTTLYLCLEDNWNRVQSRLFEVTDEAPSNAYFAISSCTLSDGLEKQITDFVAEHPDTVLVTIDTFQLIRNTEKDTSYSNDYQEIEKLKALTDYLIECSRNTDITVTDLSEVLVALKRIGNNINQIAHKVNSKRFFFGNFNSVIEGQRKIYDAILNLTGDDS